MALPLKTQENRNGGSHRGNDRTPWQPIAKIQELPIRTLITEGISPGYLASQRSFSKRKMG